MSEARTAVIEAARVSREASARIIEVSSRNTGALSSSWSAGAALGIEDNEIELGLLSEEAEVARDGVLRLEPWVNQTPLTVGPQTPLETVVQMFKRLGPRVILIEKFGTLTGLITVKDVLRFIEKEEHEPSSLDRNQRDAVEIILEESWMWLTARFRSLVTR